MSVRQNTVCVCVGKNGDNDDNDAHHWHRRIADDVRHMAAFVPLEGEATELAESVNTERECTFQVGGRGRGLERWHRINSPQRLCAKSDESCARNRGAKVRSRVQSLPPMVREGVEGGIGATGSVIRAP